MSDISRPPIDDITAEATLSDYVAALERRLSLIIIVAICVITLTVIGTAFWSKYVSSATIQVRGGEISKEMTVPIGMSPSAFVTSVAQYRVSEIEQQVESTASLAQIINKLNLYPKNRDSTPIDDLTSKMRKKINLTMLESDLAKSATTRNSSSDSSQMVAFGVSFTYSDPVVAQEVCNELVSRFLDQDLQERRSEAKETSKLLSVQISSLEELMDGQEKKIAAFRADHPDSRPESMVFNQQMAATTSVDLQNADRDIQENQRNLGNLQAQLATVEPYTRVIDDGQVLTTPQIQLKALRAKYASLIGQYGPQHPDLMKLKAEILSLQATLGVDPNNTNLESALIAAQTNLAAADKTYGALHPDVQALRGEVAGLEAEAANARAKGLSPIKGDADNPAYLMLVSQVQAAEEQQRVLLRQRDELLQLSVKYQANVAETPANEQELALLSRDYDNAQLRYRELKEKKMSADMDQQVEQGRVGERLEMIEPPDLPINTSPSRPLLLVGGIVGALVAGVIAAGLAEALERNVYGPAQVTRLVGMPPLIVVSHIATATEQSSLRNRGRKIAFGVAVLMLIIIAIIVI